MRKQQTPPDSAIVHNAHLSVGLSSHQARLRLTAVLQCLYRVVRRRWKSVKATSSYHKLLIEKYKVRIRKREALTNHLVRLTLQRRILCNSWPGLDTRHSRVSIVAMHTRTSCAVRDFTAGIQRELL
jgi:hypothetical protein